MQRVQSEKKSWIQILILIFAVCIGVSVTALTVSAAWHESDGKFYNDKGKEIKGAVTRGVDISYWDGNVDWAKIKKAGFDFAFIRVGHGDEPIDKNYHTNMKQAIAQDIPVGVYYYSEALTTARAKEDAQFVLKNIQGYSISYPIVFDMESSLQTSLSKKKATDITLAFCREIQKAGYYPMIYCSESWYKQQLDGSRLDAYDKWIARYASTYDTSIERQIWQATNKGSVSGVKVDCDIDFGFVDYTTKITPRKEAKEGTLTTATGTWIEDGKGSMFRYYKGQYAKKWKQIDDKWYYFNSSYYRTTGWKQLSGKWYFFDETGVRQTGWVTWLGTRYYLDKNGAMKTGWMTLKEKKYYLDSTGAMKTGWVKKSGKWYYFNSSGVMQKSKWIGIYYVDAKGVWTKTKG